MSQSGLNLNGIVEPPVKLPDDAPDTLNLDGLVDRPAAAAPRSKRRGSPVHERVRELARMAKIDDDIFDDYTSVVSFESGGRHRRRDGSVQIGAVNRNTPERAVGAAQALPSTIRQYRHPVTGKTLDPYNEEDNLLGGVMYFHEGYQKTKAIAGRDPSVGARIYYFGGPGKTENQGWRLYARTGRIPPGQDANGTTFQKYVERTRGGSGVVPAGQPLGRRQGKTRPLSYTGGDELNLDGIVEPVATPAPELNLGGVADEPLNLDGIVESPPVNGMVKAQADVTGGGQREAVSSNVLEDAEIDPLAGTPAPLSDEDETRFRRWYAEQAANLGLDPDPDAPAHRYDYRAAFEAGAQPDASGHWPSQFKAADHPNRYVDGTDTITGERDARGFKPLEFSPYDAGELSFTARAAMGAAQQAQRPETDLAAEHPDRVGRAVEIRIKANKTHDPTESEIIDAALETLGSGYGRISKQYRAETGRNIGHVDQVRSHYDTRTGEHVFEFAPALSLVRIANAYARGGLREAADETKRIDEDRAFHEPVPLGDENEPQTATNTLADIGVSSAQTASNVLTGVDAMVTGLRYGTNSPEYDELLAEDKMNQRVITGARESIPEEKTMTRRIVRGIATGVLNPSNYMLGLSPGGFLTAHAIAHGHEGTANVRRGLIQTAPALGVGGVVGELAGASSYPVRAGAQALTGGGVNAATAYAGGERDPSKLAEQFGIGAGMGMLMPGGRRAEVVGIEPIASRGGGRPDASGEHFKITARDVESGDAVELVFDAETGEVVGAPRAGIEQPAATVDGLTASQATATPDRFDSALEAYTRARFGDRADDAARFQSHPTIERVRSMFPTEQRPPLSPLNDSPTPETSATLAAQVDALVAGRRPAVLVTRGAEMPEVPRGMKAVATPRGTFIFDPARVGEREVIARAEDGSFGELLGHVEPKSPATDQVVVATDARTGGELQSSLVSPENLAAQRRELGRQFPEARVESGAVDGELAQSVLFGRDSQTSATRPRMVEPIPPKETAPGWQAFPPDSNSLNIPRASMPQIKGEHRGALVQFLKGRGITHAQVEVAPRTLRPSQAEFSPEKVNKAKGFEGEKRSILVSSDGYVLDGHHQWLSDLTDAPDVPIPAIRLNAPIQQLLVEVARFPSSGVDKSSGGASSASTGTPPARIVSREPLRPANAKGRDVVVVELPSGERQAFYRSSGINSKKKGAWFPFSRVDNPDTNRAWFDKDAFNEGDIADRSHELHRYGRPELKTVGEWLGNQEIPAGRDVTQAAINAHIAEMVAGARGSSAPAAGGEAYGSRNVVVSARRLRANVSKR